MALNNEQLTTVQNTLMTEVDTLRNTLWQMLQGNDLRNYSKQASLLADIQAHVQAFDDLSNGSGVAPGIGQEAFKAISNALQSGEPSKQTG